VDITNDLICTYLSQRQVLPGPQMVNAKLSANSKEEPTHVQGWCSITSSPRTLRVDHIIYIHQPLSETGSKKIMVRQSSTRHLDILCYDYNTRLKKREHTLAKREVILN